MMLGFAIANWFRSIVASVRAPRPCDSCGGLVHDPRAFRCWACKAGERLARIYTPAATCCADPESHAIPDPPPLRCSACNALADPDHIWCTDCRRADLIYPAPLVVTIRVGSDSCVVDVLNRSGVALQFDEFTDPAELLGARVGAATRDQILRSARVRVVAEGEEREVCTAPDPDCTCFDCVCARYDANDDPCAHCGRLLPTPRPYDTPTCESCYEELTRTGTSYVGAPVEEYDPDPEEEEYDPDPEEEEERYEILVAGDGTIGVYSHARGRYIAQFPGWHHLLCGSDDAEDRSFLFDSDPYDAPATLHVYGRNSDDPRPDPDPESDPEEEYGSPRLCSSCYTDPEYYYRGRAHGGSFRRHVDGYFYCPICEPTILYPCEPSTPRQPSTPQTR